MQLKVSKQLNINKLLKRLVFVGLLMLIVIIFSQKIELTAVDLGRHIQNGRVVWQDTGVLFNNFYSYTEPNFSFINHHWLSGVIYYVLYLIGGFKLLSLFNLLLILGTFSLAFRMARKRVGFYWATLLAIPTIFLLSERTEIRPEIFSYLFVFLTWFILEKADEKKKLRLLWWLLPLFLFWVNIHIYFFLGLVLVGFKAASKFIPAFIKKSGNIKTRFLTGWQYSRAWILNFCYLIIACLFNPNTFSGLLYPFNIFKNYGYAIAENKTVFFLEKLMINFNYSLFKLFLFALVLSWIAHFFFKRKTKWFELATSLLLAILGLMFSRNLAIFALVTWVIISTNLAPVIKYLKKEGKNLKIGKINYQSEFLLLGLILLIIMSATYLALDMRNRNNFLKSVPGLGLYSGNDDSVEFFKEHNLSGPIFNNYDLGSALILWLYPQEKVFVDNRPEAYSNEFFQEIYRPIQEDEVAWLKYSAEYHINVIYFSHTDSTPWAKQFLYRRMRDPHWPLIYFDRYTVIMIEDVENNREIIEGFAIDSWEFRSRMRDLVNTSDTRSKFYLAGLSELANQPDLAEEIYRGILFKQPNNRQALYSLGALYANRSDRASLFNSLKYLQRSIDAGYHLPAVYNQMGLVYWQLKDYDNAEKSWRRTLKIDRRNAGALDYLKQIKQLKLGGRLLMQ